MIEVQWCIRYQHIIQAPKISQTTLAFTHIQTDGQSISTNIEQTWGQHKQTPHQLIITDPNPAPRILLMVRRTTLNLPKLSKKQCPLEPCRKNLVDLLWLHKMWWSEPLSRDILPTCWTPALFRDCFFRRRLDAPKSSHFLTKIEGERSNIQTSYFTLPYVYFPRGGQTTYFKCVAINPLTLLMQAIPPVYPVKKLVR